MKTKEIRELSTNEIEERINAERALFEQMKLDHSVTPLDNSSQIKLKRRTVARLKTELRQRQLNSK